MVLRVVDFQRVICIFMPEASARNTIAEVLEGNVPGDGAFALFLHPLPGENANARGLARGWGWGTARIGLFTVSFSHLHYNVM